MQSVSPTATRRPCSTAASASRFAELVRKSGTSATVSTQKRKTRARKRLLGVVKEQRRVAKTAGLRAVAMTLTFSNDASFCARHISAFLARVRQVLKRRGHSLPYTWVLERGGRLHYHLMLWLPRDFFLDKEKLAEWWPWGATWTANCKHVKRWGRYMAKFKCMAYLPKAARLFGCGGLDDSGKATVRHASLPRWLQALVPRGTQLRRCPGFGWVNTVTAEIHRSPYRWTPRGWSRRDKDVSSRPSGTTVP